MKKSLGMMASTIATAALLAATATLAVTDPATPVDQRQLEARIDATPGLTMPERSQMRANLEACSALGIEPEQIGSLFPGAPGGDPHPAAALRLQSMVIRAARGDLPVEPLLAKIREGRMKGVPDEALVRAGEQVVGGMVSARDVLAAAADVGLAPADDDAERREQVRVLSRAMWRGLTPEDAARLQLQARGRPESVPGTTADLVAAAETTVRIREQGGDPEDSLRLVGTALARGYTAGDLVELGRMVSTWRLGGDDIDALLTDLTGRVDAGFAQGELYRYLMQAGWMGPVDAPGVGGRQGVGHQGDGTGNGGGGGDTGGGTAGGQQGDGGTH